MPAAEQAGGGAPMTPRQILLPAARPPGRRASPCRRPEASLMPRSCATCGHPDRAGIDAVLLSDVPLHGGLRGLAKRYSLSLDGLSRHRRNHLREEPVQSRKSYRRTARPWRRRHRRTAPGRWSRPLGPRHRGHRRYRGSRRPCWPWPGGTGGARWPPGRAPSASLRPTTQERRRTSCSGRLPGGPASFPPRRKAGLGVGPAVDQTATRPLVPVRPAGGVPPGLVHAGSASGASRRSPPTAPPPRPPATPAPRLGGSSARGRRGAPVQDTKRYGRGCRCATTAQVETGPVDHRAPSPSHHLRRALRRLPRRPAAEAPAAQEFVNDGNHGLMLFWRVLRTAPGGPGPRRRAHPLLPRRGAPGQRPVPAHPRGDRRPAGAGGRAPGGRAGLHDAPRRPRGAGDGAAHRQEGPGRGAADVAGRPRPAARLGAPAAPGDPGGGRRPDHRAPPRRPGHRPLPRPALRPQHPEHALEGLRREGGAGLPEGPGHAPGGPPSARRDAPRARGHGGALRLPHPLLRRAFEARGWARVDRPARDQGHNRRTESLWLNPAARARLAVG